MNHPLQNPGTSSSNVVGDSRADGLDEQPVALSLLNAGNVMWWLQKLTLTDATLRAAVRLERRPTANVD
jgi:hypothetical protein